MELSPELAGRHWARQPIVRRRPAGRLVRVGRRTGVVVGEFGRGRKLANLFGRPTPRLAALSERVHSWLFALLRRQVKTSGAELGPTF